MGELQPEVSPFLLLFFKLTRSFVLSFHEDILSNDTVH